MRKTLLSLILFSLSLLPLNASTNWVPVAEALRKSIVYLEANDGACTGFVSNADVRKDGRSIDRDYVLTAAHCDGDKLYAGGATTRIEFKDTKKDLMVLSMDDLDKPALRLAKDNPKIGEEVASYGFGFALERPLFRTAHVSDDDLYIPENGIGGPFIVTDAVFVGGQSGGPVVNSAGEVVLIVQRGGGGVGLGVGAKVIRDKVGRYFEKEIKP